MTIFADLDDADRDEMLIEQRRERWHQRQLSEHPDPRDPDHPEPDDTENDYD